MHRAKGNAPEDAARTPNLTPRYVSKAKRIGELDSETWPLTQDRGILDRLCQRLFEMGGETVEFICPEREEMRKDLRRQVRWPAPEAEAILLRGQVFPGKIKLVHGVGCECYQNAAKLWKAEKSLLIANGFGLSYWTGCWYEHAWVVSPTGEVIETTVEKARYFGIVLSYQKAERFWRLNVWKRGGKNLWETLFDDGGNPMRTTVCVSADGSCSIAQVPLSNLVLM